MDPMMFIAPSGSRSAMASPSQPPRQISPHSFGTAFLL